MASLGLAAPLAGQGPATVVGRVIRLVDTDSVPVARAAVVLHGVSLARQGALDSVRTDDAGRFRFRFVTADSTVYLLSVSHHGISYFSTPVARDPVNRVDDILLIVSDTAGTAPVGLAGRSLVVGGREASGGRTVLEIFEIVNRGQRTRVAPDSQPTLRIPLVRGSTGAAVQDTDFSSEAVQVVHDTLLISAPIAPGDHVVIVQSTMPGGTRQLELPPGLGADTVQVVLDQDGLGLKSELPAAGEQVIDGRPYDRWIGPWDGAEAIVIGVRGVAISQGTALVLLVTALVAALGGGLILLGRQRRRQSAGAPVAASQPRQRSAAELLEAVAMLDARHRDAERTVPAQEWQRYQAERARLKAELERALARREAAP